MSRRFRQVAIVAAQEILLVADPDISPVPLAEAVLGGVPALLEQLALLGFDGREVVGMNVVTPEIGMFQIFLRAIAE